MYVLLFTVAVCGHVLVVVRSLCKLDMILFFSNFSPSLTQFGPICPTSDKFYTRILHFRTCL